MTTFQIELNEARYGVYYYLKKDGTVTCFPEDALEFSTFEECEKVRKEMDKHNKFHTQKMWTGC